MSAAPSTVALLDALTEGVEDGFVAISSVTSRGWRTHCFHVSDVDSAAEAAARADRAGLNVYVRTNLLAAPVEPWRRGRADETVAVPALVVDLDVAGPGHAERDGDGLLPLPPDRHTALEVVADLPAPSLTVDTGGGLHLWWLLDRPQLERPAELVGGWADRVVEAGRRRGWHVDRPDVARVLRLPGTHRRKPQVEPNRVELVGAARWPEVGITERRPWGPLGRYEASELIAALPTPSAPAPSAPPPGVVPPPPAAVAPTAPAERPLRGSGIGPADAVAALSWAQILAPAGFELHKTVRIGGQSVELWRRPGQPSSKYSIKCFTRGPAVVWSDRCGLPVGRGRRLNKWRVFVLLYAGGDEAEAARTIRRMAREMS